MQCLVIIALAGVCLADFANHGGQKHSNLARTGKQNYPDEDNSAVPGGVDFSGCVTDSDTGLCCVEKEETVTSLEKEPILECTHKNTEQCHYTYVTQLSQPNSTSTGVGA